MRRTVFITSKAAELTHLVRRTLDEILADVVTARAILAASDATDVLAYVDDDDITLDDYDDGPFHPSERAMEQMR